MKHFFIKEITDCAQCTHRIFSVRHSFCTEKDARTILPDPYLGQTPPPDWCPLPISLDSQKEIDALKQQVKLASEAADSALQELEEANDIAMGYKGQINNANKVLSELDDYARIAPTGRKGWEERLRRLRDALKPKP